MKRIFSILLIATIALLITGCPKQELTQEVKRNQVDQDYCQRVANYTINSITYIKDPRTNLCYAYTSSGGMYGGPGLACVSCDSIPTGMLWTAEISNEYK
jgi:hypothetical protein